MALTRITQGVIKPGEDYQVNNINSTGIITATSFSGDGSSLTGVSGFADAVGQDCGLNQVFVTPITLTLGGASCGIKTITATAEQGNVAFVRAKNITIATGSTIHITSGTTVKTNVLGVF